MDSQLNNEIKRISKLVQYKTATKEFLTKIAQKNVVLRELLHSSNFVDDAEKHQAKMFFEKYLEKREFEDYSELTTLSMLVYNEILINRLQKTINELTNKDGKTYINDKLIKSLHDVENQIFTLKEKLGLDKDQKVDNLNELQLLKKRFADYIQENKNEFTTVCAKCGNLLLLRRRVKDFDVLVHPHFVGRFWLNKYALEMVEQTKLSKEDYAKIFETSVDFVDWLLKNKGKIISEEK